MRDLLVSPPPFSHSISECQSKLNTTTATESVINELGVIQQVTMLDLTGSGDNEQKHKKLFDQRNFQYEHFSEKAGTSQEQTVMEHESMAKI